MDKRKLSLAIATQLLIVTSSPVLALSSITPQHNWSGAYVGLAAGSGTGNANTSFTNNINTDSSAEGVGSTTRTTTANYTSGNLDGNINGSIANLFIGYNLQHPNHLNFIFGAQIEGNFFNQISLDTKGSQRNSTMTTVDDGVVTSITEARSTTDVELRDTIASMFTLLARGGVLVNPNTLVYVLGGGVEGNFVNPNDTLFANQKRNIWSAGYVIGGGLEYRFNDTWSLRGEYRYINFANIKRNQASTTSTITNPEGPNNTTSSATQNASSTTTGFNFNMGLIDIVYRIA